MDLVLIDAYRTNNSIDILYNLLKERTKDESISHKEMPSLEDHVDYIRKHPHPSWYIIYDGSIPVGSIYVGKEKNIGIAIFKKYRRKGYAKAAIKLLLSREVLVVYANVNPKNKKSIKLFQSLGFKLIQNTYKLD